jgi:hypothetical protein
MQHFDLTVNPLEELGPFVRLEQDARAFKMVVYGLGKFLDTLGGAIERKGEHSSRPTRQNTTKQSRTSQLSVSFQDQSQKLFSSLVAHTTPCLPDQSKHEAMLQLKHLEHCGDRLPNPELCMLLPLCLSQGHWGHVSCSILQKEEYEEHPYNIPDMLTSR